MHNKLPRACVIAAVNSGSGKTTVSLGIMRALASKGLRVQPFKAGPDYLDGTYHALAAGNPSYNLDTWMVDTVMLKDHFHSRLDGCNVGIVEGVMGLYDGFEGTLTGSTADLARTLEIPVILLVDCKGLSASVAPIVHGFRTFRSDVQIAGVILNRTGSERHVRYLKEALAPLDIPVIGHLPRNEDLALEHRHLGLFAAQHGDATEEKIGNIADAVEKTVDLDLLMKICVEVETCTLSAKCKSDPPKRTCRIAVARDAAFHFYYQANLDMLQAAGAELVFFSPLKDTALPCGIDGLLLGGGYPEEHSVELSGNMTMRDSIRNFSSENGCIYAECGGYMYLGDHIEKNGACLPMCGVFPAGFRMNDGTGKSLGYREITLTLETVIGPSGLKMRGHEFHYSSQKQTDSNICRTPFAIRSRNSLSPSLVGMSIRNTIGSYLHVHFLSCPEIGSHFIDSCVTGKKKQDTSQ